MSEQCNPSLDNKTITISMKLFHNQIDNIRHHGKDIKNETQSGTFFCLIFHTEIE